MITRAIRVPAFQARSLPKADQLLWSIPMKASSMGTSILNP